MTLGAFQDNQDATIPELHHNKYLTHQPNMQLPVNVLIEGEVPHVDRSGVVWFTPDSIIQDLSTMMDQLQETELKQQTAVQPGQLGVARYSADQELYRVRVLATHQRDASVTVLYLDYGNIETKPSYQLFHLPLQFANLPPAAVPLKPARMINKEDVQKVEARLSTGKCKALITKFGAEELARFYLKDEEVLFGKERNANVSEKVSRFSSPSKLPQGTKTRVVMRFVENIRKLWVTPVGTIAVVEAVMAKLNSQSLQKMLVPAANPTVGQVVVSWCSEGGKLYRARITSTEAMASQHTIHFIDYGNTQVCPGKQLYSLPEEVSTERFPPGAFDVFLDMKNVRDNKERRGLLESLLLQTDPLEVSVQGKVGTFYSGSEVLTFEAVGSSSEEEERVEIEAREVECLRDEDTLNESRLSLGLEDCSFQASMLEEKLPIRPAARFEARAAHSGLGGDWRVGDTVLAFWPTERRWRAAVIHELHRTEALVVSKEAPHWRPVMVDLTNLKPVSIPVDALNQMESELQQLKTKESYPSPSLEPSLDSDPSPSLEPVLDLDPSPSLEPVMEPLLPSATPTAPVAPIMTPSRLLTCPDLELSSFARTGAGSRYLQELVRPGNKKLCERIAAALLASGPLRIFTNARACFLVQKLFSYCYLLPDGLQTELLNIVRDNFTRLAVDQYGYHTVQAAVSNLGPQHTADLLIRLENPSIQSVNILVSPSDLQSAPPHCGPWLQSLRLLLPPVLPGPLGSVAYSESLGGGHIEPPPPGPAGYKQVGQPAGAGRDRHPARPRHSQRAGPVGDQPGRVGVAGSVRRLRLSRLGGRGGGPERRQGVARPPGGRSSHHQSASLLPPASRSRGLPRTRQPPRLLSRPRPPLPVARARQPHGTDAPQVPLRPGGQPAGLFCAQTYSVQSLMVSGRKSI